jgi:hypothetical protein
MPSTDPVNLVSVNTAPERAKRLIGILINDVADKYTIVHAGNSDTIEGVKPLLLSIQPPPGILFCASMVSLPPLLRENPALMGRVVDAGAARGDSTYSTGDDPWDSDSGNPDGSAGRKGSGCGRRVSEGQTR